MKTPKIAANQVAVVPDVPLELHHEVEHLGIVRGQFLEEFRDFADLLLQVI